MQSGKNPALRFLLPLFCLLSLLLAACGGGSGTGQANDTSSQASKASDDKQIYIRPYSGLSDIKTLDPALVTDLYSAQSLSMIYTGLVGLDGKGNIVKQLAASYQVSDDGLTWTFTLKDNLKFSDGNPLTSEDVVYSLDRALQPATKSPYASYYMGLIKDNDLLQKGKVKTLIGDSIIAQDAKTVIIKTSKKAAYFLYTLSYQTAFVLEKSFVQKYGNDFTNHLSEGGASGPWIVSKYQRGKEIDFTPNQYYYGPKPQLKKIVRPFYKEADTAWRAYQANQVDRSGNVPTPNIADAKALPNNQYHVIPLLSNIYFAMNYLVKPFDNIKIRQAFALALNKEVIANNVYKGTVIATNHIVPEGMPGYNPNLVGPAGVKSPAGDATLAKKLFEEGLKEDGYASAAALPPIVFEGASGGQADVRNEFATEQQMWKSVLGIDVKLNDVDFNKLSDDTTNTIGNKSLMAWWIGWIADYPDPQDWTSVQFAEGAGNNNANYGQNQSSDAAKQQETQKLLLQADANTANNDERMKQYNQAEQQLVDDVAWIPLYQQASPFVEKPCVVGPTTNSIDIVAPDDWASIYKSTATPCADVSAYK
jgi:peptide/nickel transport system substrate-binding protein/oligopeptide transport system substrate-binding protein